VHIKGNQVRLATDAPKHMLWYGKNCWNGYCLGLNGEIRHNPVIQQKLILLPVQSPSIRPSYRASSTSHINRDRYHDIARAVRDCDGCFG
jgi:hypothetical protein